MVRRDLLRGFDPEPLRQYRGQGLELHVAEPGERRDALAQIVAVRRVRPDAFGLTAVLVDHDRCELLDTLGHRAWETMNRRLLGEQRVCLVVACEIEGTRCGRRHPLILDGRRTLLGDMADPVDKAKHILHDVEHPIETAKALEHEAEEGASGRTPLIVISGITLFLGLIFVILLGIALTLYFV